MNWGDVLLATDYKTYIVGGPVVNLKLNREMCYKPQTTEIHVGGPLGGGLVFLMIGDWAVFLLVICT